MKKNLQKKRKRKKDFSLPYSSGEPMIQGLMLSIVLCYLPPVLAHFFLKAKAWSNPVFLWFPIALHTLSLVWLGGIQQLWASAAFGLSVLSAVLLVGFQVLRS